MNTQAVGMFPPEEQGEMLAAFLFWHQTCKPTWRTSTKGMMISSSEYIENMKAVA